MSRNLTTLLTLTLITVVTFMVLILSQVIFKSTIPQATQQQIELLNPTLDTGLIEDLEKSPK